MITHIIMLNGSRDKFIGNECIEHDSLWTDLLYEDYNNDDTFINSLNKG